MPHVLVVEDSSDLRAIVSLALESEGFQVREAENGQDALRVLETGGRPDVILLDLMMPIMNGWEFLDAKRAHEEYSSIPVVICSAIKPDNLNGHYFLKKPVDLSDLIETLGRVSQSPK